MIRYDDAVLELFYLVFAPRRLSLKAKKGWRLSPALDTDGVAVTFKYERQTALSDAGGLRGADRAQLEAYLAVQAAHWDDWWGVALRRCESRANMSRYLGKRSVLDGFWARVQRRLRAAAHAAGQGAAALELAYGSAHETMAPSGRGEVAAPTCAHLRHLPGRPARVWAGRRVGGVGVQHATWLTTCIGT